MVRDVVSRVDVQMVDEQLALDAVRAGECVDQLVAGFFDPRYEARVQLDAVTRLERRVLNDDGATLGTEAESTDALAQLDGRGAMTEPEADEAVHVGDTLRVCTRSESG